MATKLTHIQQVLLESAARRPDGNLLPVPETLDEPKAAIARAVASLTRRSLTEEGGEHHPGPTITAAGRAAAGVEPQDIETGIAEEAATAPLSSTSAATSKIGMVLMMLRANGGATLAELVAATGWLPHTTRAALTGLRKKGHAIAKGKRDEVTCYTLVVA